MKLLLRKIFYWCLDCVFPRLCLGCGKDGSHLCRECYESLPILYRVNCPFCGHRSPDGRACSQCRHQHHSHISGILIASDWNNLLLRQIIYEYKYRFIKELADPLANLMIKFLTTAEPVNRQTDKLILIPVPLHGRRLAWRGFNQSEILTKKIADYFNLVLIDNILIRSRHTIPQREIKKPQDRAANIKNVFALNPEINLENKNLLKNKIIILIDDICTTGATFEDCARALQPLGPKEIWGLVIARG